jgi:hypothetical protein
MAFSSISARRQRAVLYAEKVALAGWTANHTGLVQEFWFLRAMFLDQAYCRGAIRLASKSEDMEGASPGASHLAIVQ